MKRMIEVDSLSKSYGRVRALDGVSFSVRAGELFGIIGPDGAGKTTLFRLLTTLLTPDAGRARVGGCDTVADYRTIRRRIGYMPGRFSLYPDLTVEENLTLFATVFGTTIAENYDLIKDIYQDIEPFRHRPAGKLSGGMKQKLALSCALIHKPEVLFLDEPTTGIDATSRKELWQMLRRLARQGITLVVSTPYMDEACLCDRVMLLENGRTMATATPDELVQRFPKPLFSAVGPRMYPLLKALRRLPEVESCYAFGSTHHLTFRTSPPPDLQEICRHLQQEGMEGVEIRPIRPTVEDCYMQLARSTSPFVSEGAAN